MLKVGMDAWNLPNDRRGIGRYVREILRVWQRYPERVETTLIVPEWHTWSVADRYQREIEGAPLPVVSRSLHRLAKLDVLWFPFNGCSWKNFSLPAVATLHDATPFVLGDYNSDAQVIMHNAAERCQALITDSRFSQHELARALGIPPERLTPVPLGVNVSDRATTTPQIEALKPYILFVGNTERRKGLDVLVEAMRYVNERYPDHSLALAGVSRDAFHDSDSIRLHALGYVDDAQLDALYRNATLLAFPSRYEGFGLPVLEAMARGTPVVASDSTSIPEAGGDAAHYVLAGDPEKLGAAMLRVIEDAELAATLRRRGLARASEMNWTSTALRTLEVLESI